jgi:hypothetical protein
MPDIGTMHQLNPEPPHIGTMHQLGSEPLHTGGIITPQAQAEEYAREAQESAANAALSAAAAQSAAETAQQAAESIAPALNEKADAIHTATGPAPIVSIPDAAAAPVDALMVGIEPVQDLHGYKNPWPAGGGVNKLNIVESAMVSSGYDRFFPITLAAGTYSITCFGTFGNGFGSAIDLDSAIGVSGSTVKQIAPSYAFGRTQGATYSFTLTQEEAEAVVSMHMRVNGAGITFADIVAGKLQIELGSSTAWTPYSNICPITGWTGAKVTRTGRNLFDQDNTSFLSGNVRSYGNYDKLALQQINTLPAGTYTLSFSEEVVSLNGIEPVETRLGLYLRSVSNGAVFNVNAQSALVMPSVGYKITKSVTFTLTEEYVGKFMYFYVYSGKNDAHGAPNEYTAVFSNIQLELGSTATSYEPYQGETYSITFPTEAGTVYGGSLDVTTGVLTVDRAIDTITKDSNWYSFATGTGNSSAVVQMTDYLNVKYVDGSSSRNGAMSSTGTEAQNYWINPRQNEIPEDGDMCFAYSSTGQLRIHRNDVTSITDLASFKANFPDTQICYPLATPITYTLTPQEITTILGTNNIWADTGDVTVGYKADTKLYIDKKFAELQALILEN